MSNIYDIGKRYCLDTWPLIRKRLRVFINIEMFLESY